MLRLRFVVYCSFTYLGVFSLHGAASAASFPVSARLQVAPPAQQHCLHTPGQSLVDCTIVDEAHTAFAAEIDRLFAPGSSSTLDLVLTVTDAQIFEQVSGGMQFEVRTATRLLTPGGSTIDEIEGLARISVTEVTSVPAAAQAAAKSAAADFARKLENSGHVRDYLVGARLSTSSELAPPARGDRYVWLALGGALVQGGGDGGDLGISPGFRVTVGMGWLVLQATYAHLTTSFQGTSQLQTFGADLSSNDLGFEAGAALRLTSNIELHAGPGVHFLFANASSGFVQNDVSASKIVPEVFGSLSISLFPLRNGARFVGGLEARGYFGTRLDLNEFNRGVPVANTTFGLFFGTELPWGPKGTSR
jgi:hypothetical protein